MLNNKHDNYKYRKIGTPPTELTYEFIINYYCEFHTTSSALNPVKVENNWNVLLDVFKGMNDVEREWIWKWANKYHHDTFVNTKYWYIISSKKKLDMGCCENCGSTERLEVHHPTYTIKGDEHNNMDVLVVLCKKCHDKEHNIVERIYKSKNTRKTPPNSLNGTILHALLLLHKIN